MGGLECEVCVDVCCGISLRTKLDFSAKKNEFPFCRLWISSGDTAGNLTNCFQIRNEMELLFKCRHFSLDSSNVKMYFVLMADDFFNGRIGSAG